MSKSVRDNAADMRNSNNTTLNHNNHAYKTAQDNHANQMNPNNPNFTPNGK